MCIAFLGFELFKWTQKPSIVFKFSSSVTFSTLASNVTAY